MRFAIHACGNVNVMTWIPCKGYRPKPISLLLLGHFCSIFPRSPPRNFVASHVATQVTQAFVQALLAVATPHPCIDERYRPPPHPPHPGQQDDVTTNVTIPHPTHPIPDKHQGQQDDVTTNVTIRHPTHPIPDKHQGQQADVTTNVTIPHPTHPIPDNKMTYQRTLPSPTPPTPSQTNIKDNKMT